MKHGRFEWNLGSGRIRVDVWIHGRCVASFYR